MFAGTRRYNGDIIGAPLLVRMRLAFHNASPYPPRDVTVSIEGCRKAGATASVKIWRRSKLPALPAHSWNAACASGTRSYRRTSGGCFHPQTPEQPASFRAGGTRKDAGRAHDAVADAFPVSGGTRHVDEVLPTGDEAADSARGELPQLFSREVEVRENECVATLQRLHHLEVCLDGILSTVGP